MGPSFQEWFESLQSGQDDEPGEPGAGVRELLQAIFDARGPISESELDEAFERAAEQLLDQAIALFMADVRRTTTLNPNIRVFRDEHGSLAVSWNGNWNTPVFFAIREPEATCEIADNLRDHVVDALSETWPLCPTHGFGLNPLPVKSRALWWCAHHQHEICTIGQLPPTAAARHGLRH